MISCGPVACAGLLGGVRAGQVDHADGAHHRAVTREVARPHHLAAVSRLQRGLQVRAEHGQRAGLGGAGRRPDVRRVVERELRRIEPGDGQRLGIGGPGLDVLPLAQGLVEAGGPGRVGGQPQRRRHRRVDPRLVQVLVGGEPGPGRDHGGRGEPRDAGPDPVPGPPAAPPSGPGHLAGGVRRGLRVGEVGVVRPVAVRVVLDGERAGRRMPGAERACRGFGRVAHGRETLGRRMGQLISPAARAEDRVGAAAAAEDGATPAARADQAIRSRPRADQAIRSRPRADQAIRSRPRSKDPVGAAAGRQDRLGAAGVRVRGAVRRRPGWLTARVRGRSGAFRAPMVHNVERSVLFSSGRVDAELSRLGFALASLRETEYAALASCATGMHAVCVKRGSRRDAPRGIPRRAPRAALTSRCGADEDHDTYAKA